MAAYYNEINPYAAQWIRNLIEAGLIADGVVDERSIEEITPNELREFKQCHFFAGIGIWSRALRDAGWSDDEEVWTGSCPCQPFSQAGKGEGFDDKRHLWPAFHYLIEQCRPPVVFGEQVAGKDGYAWLDLVQSDLEATDYRNTAVELCAAGFGAPHIRQRLYWLAHTDDYKRKREITRSNAEENGSEAQNGKKIILTRESSRSGEFIPEQDICTQYGKQIPLGGCKGAWEDVEWLDCLDGRYRPTEPGLFPLVNGDTRNLDKLRTYGNAIVLPVATGFIESFMDLY